MATTKKTATKTKSAVSKAKETKAVKSSKSTKSSASVSREPKFVIEYANQRITTDDILKRIKDDLKSKGAKRTASNALDIYVQPENNDVYYVSNAGTVKELTGKIDLV